MKRVATSLTAVPAFLRLAPGAPRVSMVGGLVWAVEDAARKLCRIMDQPGGRARIERAWELACKARQYYSFGFANKQAFVDETKRYGDAYKLVVKFQKAMKAALATRTNRVQAQMPFGQNLLRVVRAPNALLEFVTDHHVGVEGLRTKTKPGETPRYLPKKMQDEHEYIAEVIEAVHQAYHGLPVAYDLDYVAQWVRSEPIKQTLQKHEREFELNDPNVAPTVEVVQPQQCEFTDVVTWTQYHGTTKPRQTATPAGTMFADAVPRYAFTENVWRVYYTLVQTTPIDVGAGSLRGSFVSFKHGICEDPTYNDTDPRHAHWFGAPLPDDERNRVVEYDPTKRNGVHQTNVAPQKLQRVVEAFEQFVNRVVDASIPRTDDDDDKPRVTITSADGELNQAFFGTGQARAEARRQLPKSAFNMPQADGQPNECAQSGALLPRSGYGLACSHFGGKHKLAVQANIAREILEKAYGAHVVIILERCRLTTEGGLQLHADTSEQSEQLKRDIRQLY